MMPSETKSLQTSQIRKEKIFTWIELIPTIIVLIAVCVAGYTNLFMNPYKGFTVDLNSGELVLIEPYAEPYLQETDRILKVNGIPTKEINKKVQNNPFLQTKEGESMVLTILREGDEIELSYQMPPQTTKLASDILFNDWILPIPFFAAGLITTLFVRPRTKTRSLLILFFYSYAIWIGAGTISNLGYWHSPIIMRLFVWLSIPINFHLHWNFPRPFKPIKKWGISTIYAIFIGIATLELLSPPQSGLYFIGFLLSTMCSLMILLVKFFHFRDIRKIMGFLLLAYLLALLPILVIIVLSIAGVSTASGGVTLLGLTAIPGFYFFSAYRINLSQKNRNINLAMRLYTIGLLVVFILNFAYFFLPNASYDPFSLNVFSFLMIIFIMLTGFGVLLIIPALAEDQADMFTSEPSPLRPSANRAASIINYLLFLAPIILIAILLIPRGKSLSFDVLILMILSNLTFVAVTLMIYPKYKEIFERHVLGIIHPPEELIRNYAHRITTSLDTHSLADLLKKEVLPSLLIRESALFSFVGHTGVTKLFSTGVKIEDQDFEAFLNQSPFESTQEFQINLKNVFPWAHFALPLQVEGEVLGLWIFGRIDPNNIYDKDLIKDLNSLANQTTLALLNIRQGALLQSLYKSNVDRQEEQKANVARDLHDVLLPNIGYLVELQSNNCDPLEFEEAVQRVNNMVREIMSGLRPSSLDMGLNIALEELADEPEAQIGGMINIITELQTPTEPIYYDKDVELHLYRMVQQACRNTLEHAQANAIHIKGKLSEDSIDLVVADDGVGFPFAEIPDLGQLIVEHHFGLANILERANIINADVKIESQPRKGTQISFHWPSRERSG